MAIFGTRPRSFSPIAYYSAPEEVRKGDYLLINGEHGPLVVQVASGPVTALPGVGEESLPRAVRKASEEDLAIHHKNRETSREAFEFCKGRIRERGLDMKLVDVEIFFDRSKYIFYFTAPGRIDFRELVKDLVAEYRARIELRQIGVRHETQMIGAMGNCGQLCCCRRHLHQFAPVTIRMAKEQNLFLNPAKISGICGRLLCCLSYEQDNYEQFHRESPRPGKKYQTDRGLLKIVRVSMFQNSVSALDEKNTEIEISLDDWPGLHPQPRGQDSGHHDPAMAWTKMSYDNDS